MSGKIRRYRSRALIFVAAVAAVSAGALFVAARHDVVRAANPLPAAYAGIRDMDLGAGVSEVPVPKRKSRVEISAPGELKAPDTEYVLKNDIAADGTAFTISADRVTLNLNGHRVLYNVKPSSEGPKSVYGVAVPQYGHKDIAIVNGTIEQGQGNGSGNETGWGHNPIHAVGVYGLEIGGINAIYSGDSVTGFFLHLCYSSDVHHNTVEDRGKVVINRHQGLDAIRLEGKGAKFHHNVIKRCRHRAFNIGNDTEVFNNEIHIESHATNSYGVMAYRVKDFSIHHNRISGVGEHPIGVGAVSGSENGTIYSNYIEVQNTAKSSEYGSAGSAAVRMTWGTDKVEVYGNTLIVRANNGLSPWSESWGRAVWAGLPKQGQKALFRDNVIIAENNDGKSKAAAIAVVCDNESSGLEFRNNIVISNWANVLLADNYGYAGGFPRFVGNTFIRSDGAGSYRTIRSQYPGRQSTALFIGNRFSGGASEESIDLEFNGSGFKEAAFGGLVRVKALGGDGKPVAGASVTLIDGSGNPAGEYVTGEDGAAGVEVIGYRLTNSGGKKEKKVSAPYKLKAAYGEMKAEKTISPAERGEIEIKLR